MRLNRKIGILRSRQPRAREWQTAVPIRHREINCKTGLVCLGLRDYFCGLASLSWRFQSSLRASAPAASASLIMAFFW